MQSQFLQQFYDQLFKSQLKNCQATQPLFYYIQVITNVCKRMKQVCNNSRTAVIVFCQYIANKLMIRQLQMPSNPEHELLKCLKVQENYIIYFNQIAFRIFLLSYLCKLGQESKRKQWKIGLQQLFKQTQIQFMFNSHDSLATIFVDFLQKIEPVCNQTVFYEKLIKLFGKYDLDYVVEKIQEKINKNKQNWRVNLNKSKNQFTPKPHTKNVQNSSKETQKVKNQRKSVKILDKSQKTTPDENLRKRISDFRQSQKRRFSQHHQSGKRRTIFQSRKYMTKNNMNSQTEQYEQQMFIDQEYMQNGQLKQPIQQLNHHQKQPQVNIVKQQIKILNNPNRPLNKSVHKDKYSKDIYDNDQNYIVPGTPPKIKKLNSNSNS